MRNLTRYYGRYTGIFLILILGLFIGVTSRKNSGIPLDNPSSVVQTLNSDDGTKSILETTNHRYETESNKEEFEISKPSSESELLGNGKMTSSRQRSTGTTCESKNISSQKQAASSNKATSSTTKPTTMPSAAPKTAEQYVDDLTLAEQVAQMFFARCPSSGAVEEIKRYAPGGYILFARDFENQTPSSIKKIIQGYQNAASVPMLIGVDEEGGTVVRISKFPAFRSTPFSSPAEIYASGGTAALMRDSKEKDQLLKSLGINVNLAPVCDVTTNPDDYMYRRTLGKEAKETAEGIKAIVNQMTADRMGAVLKHFPGYGNNVDTHTGIAIDDRSLDSFRKNDYLPFIAGIEAGAGGVLVNHNIINSMDASRPATLSPAVHAILRNELNFQGVIMTDDLSMSAITKYTNGKNAAVSAVLAGNDLLISSDFVNQYRAVLAAAQEGIIPQTQIRSSVIRIIQWKIELGLITL